VGLVDVARPRPATRDRGRPECCRTRAMRATTRLLACGAVAGPLFIRAALERGARRRSACTGSAGDGPPSSRPSSMGLGALPAR
jgi:hypothetical protein